MHRIAPRRTIRSLKHALCAAIVVALAIAPASALAAQPLERYHDHFTDSFSDQICGIDVDVDLTATDNFSVFADWSVKGTGSLRATVVNQLNGKSVVLSRAGQFTDAAPVVDEAAGTITFHPVLKGLPVKIQTAGGPVLLRDAGVIAFADTFDLQTGEPLSHETLVDKGPHPEAESDFTRFCDVVSGALA